MTLRWLLARELHCDPMRITKKFTKNKSIGKVRVVPRRVTRGARGGAGAAVVGRAVCTVVGGAVVLLSRRVVRIA